MKKTDDLMKILGKTHISELDTFLSEHEDQMIASEKPFAEYMRNLIKEKDLKQQEVFLNADVPDRYGYKILSEQKRTRQRDIILRICFAAGFSLEETQTALRLYNMTPLYVRIPRDAVLIFAFQKKIRKIADIDKLLREKDMEPLHPCGNTD